MHRFNNDVYLTVCSEVFSVLSFHNELLKKLDTSLLNASSLLCVLIDDDDESCFFFETPAIGIRVGR